ncbi:hypothetical protein BDZ89DRAFT_1139942 [Hymenopellis radicata]|nr:hypothetical protein BDZ89DRAFT_1139942 [Hymenopellis radicata]
MRRFKASSHSELIVHRVKSLISPTEPVTPRILYIGIITLSGSVFARMRAPPLQARR